MGVAKLVFLFVSVTISVIHGAEKKVKVPILECNFDDGLCPGWEHDESEEYRWKLQSGPAKDIGPQYDYTRGNDEGQYIYLDDEGKKSGKGIIRSPVMDLSQKKKHCLRFVYYARGTYPGEFRIFHSSHMRGRPLSIFNRAGPQSDNDTHWIFEDISIPLWSTGKNFDKVRFAFQAMKGRGDNNVLALDDVSVTPGSCPKFQLSRTATTATFSPSTVPPTGFVDGEVVDQTNEEVMKRNQKMIEENEERNRMIQEKNNMLNSGQAYTQDPNQPTQPTQPTQPQQTTMNPVNQTQLEIERQERIREQERQVREEAERKMKEEQERIAKAEKERKEKIEKMRKEQKEKMLKQREEEAERMKAIQEKQKEERMRKQKEEEERRELEKQKKIEDQGKKKQRHEESQKKLREEEERKKQEEEERKKKLEEERIRKIEEDREKHQKQIQGQQQNQHNQKNQQNRQNRQGQQNNNQNSGGGKRGKGKRGGGKRGGGKRNNANKKNNPNFEKCGTGYAHKTRELCCAGKKRMKRTQNALCCGKLMYNSNQKGCCGDVIYNARGTQQCCGTSLFDVTTHACCGEVSYELTSSFCADGIVQPIIT